jgi:hypothetical protein
MGSVKSLLSERKVMHILMYLEVLKGLVMPGTPVQIPD